MEHSSQNDSYTISALFYYPIKSLVYCGALRYISDNINNKFRTFEPLDSEIAQTEENNRNPPLFVVFLKGIDPTTKTKIIECSIFVIGKKTTAMRLVESSQTAFNMSKMSTDAFYSKYGNVPAVFCSKDEIKSDHKTNRVIVKKFDQAGYFYATKSTSIDLWQLVDDIYAPPQPQLQPPPPQIQPPTTTTTMVHHHHSNNKSVQPIQTTQSQSQNYISSSNEETNLISKTIDPYEKTDNLISVEKHIDPVTGQNIYVRYLNDNNSNVQMSQSKKLMYDLPESYYTDDTNTILGDQQIMVRQEKTPSPIIVEKYIKKKKPQVIIKEIHVQEPAPPPIKLVQKLDNSQLPLYAQKLTSEQPKSITTNQQQQQQQQVKVSQQQTYYKQPNTSTVVSSRKQLYNRVGQKVYAGASERHRQPTTQEQKQQPLTVVATTSQAPKLKTSSHIPDSTYQSNLYSTNYNRYAPATPQQVAHSLQAPVNPYLSYYQSLAANKYASVNHHHIQNHHHHQQQQANHPSSLNNIKPKHQTESDHRLTKSHPSQSTPTTTTTNNTTPSKYASVNANSKLNYSTNNTTYQQSGKMSEKKNLTTNQPAYKNTYDLIENVESLIEKSKNDKNSSTNNKGRKIYVIHQNETKTKTNDKKYNRKIIVIDEPNDESNEQTSSSSSSQQQQQQQQQMKQKTNDLSKEQNDMNYYGIEKRQPIKRGDKPHYSHR